MTPVRSVLAAGALAAAASAHAVVALPALKVDPRQVTVSGLSSGGFMAGQLGWAHASTFAGVGVFAAGPYACAARHHYTACMYNANIGSGMLSAMQADIDAWGAGGAIDAPSRVAAQRIFLFVGTSDFTVGPNPMNALHTQYANNGVPAAQRQYVVRSGTAHVFPTDFAAPGNNSCGSSSSPYIANCGYDGARAVLTHLYGPLNPRNDAPAAANYLEFDQTAFTSHPGMAPTGWIYVPARCAAGTVCRLHVALHGCQQNAATIGDRFVKNTGYTRWADTNDIVVLFPQTRVDGTSRPTAASGSLPNPNGCWDWVGWYGASFAQKSGTQVAAIKAMVDRVASGGAAPPATLPAPAGLAASGATDTSMTLTWSAVNGAAGYHLYRDQGRVNSAPIGGTTVTDTGLAPGTTYRWTVTALDAAGAESARSDPATGTTTGTSAACFTASNYAHTTAGRARMSGGYTLANGSNQNIGLWNVFVTTTLKRTGPNFYVLGTCP